MGRRKMKTAHVFSFAVGFLLLFSFFLLLHVNHHLSSSPSTIMDVVDTNKFASVHHRHTLTNSLLREHQHAPPRQSPPSSHSVLFPDWQVLVLSPAALVVDVDDHHDLSCVFHNGAASAARLAGTIPSSGRPAFLCTLPNSVRRLRPFYTPRLVRLGKILSRAEDAPPAASPMARWNRLAYESLSTARDVLVFAKGVNRPSVSRPAAELRCVFVDADGATVAETDVTSSAQEVFRCPHPPDIIITTSDVRVSIRVLGEEESTISTVATYKPPPSLPASKTSTSTLCASTMVYNATKFLPEWIKYHSSVGVDKFVLYDNGSEDDLQSAAARLRDAGGYDVDVVYWPWPKTQEAAFSHAAAAHRDACAWMAFVDVDEFVFSPAWSGSDAPDRTLLGSLLPKNRTGPVGQVSIHCHEFGPSGRLAHPRGGVTQGYTCRTRAEKRHKSIVRPDAVDESLANSIHHFALDRSGKWETDWLRPGRAVVNHYKFQAWDEFRVKFRRRASSYVSDWTDRTNPGSNDRTPGLGFHPVEPEGWAGRFCEVNDTGLRDVTRRWFGGVGPGAKMDWEEE
ncbi:putative UPF0392 protein-like [Iris pallida]|uniref:Glycosyltransferase family 92 protein n=1 Tax=Iris pallida TaxID=29817 RepID=A0AAX6HEM5_IRIPA|nr:putative UPF0392 protein-like [Iris pallida]